MTPRRLVAAAFLLALVSGCGKSEPMLAGGKPVRYWVQALADPDARLRKTAAFKLGNVGPADPAALPALLDALSDADPVVRREVIMALVKCGPEARQAIPALEDLTRRDPDASVREYASKAIRKLETPQ